MILFALKYGLVLFAGAAAASYAEYKLNYNLYDLLKDKLLSLFGKKKAA